MHERELTPPPLYHFMEQSSTTENAIDPPPVESKKGYEIRDLIENQNEVRNYLKKVERRIFALEEVYLEETPGGNIIRGWDAEAKPINRKGVEPRERVFSNSSFHVYQNYKPIQDEIALESGKFASGAKYSGSEPKKKKARKARKEKSNLVSYDQDWIADY